jgi:uncharacterized XkdX family phage protein
MSKKYPDVKNYYDSKNWSKLRVKMAVSAKWITAEEYEMITGEPYEA